MTKHRVPLDRLTDPQLLRSIWKKQLRKKFRTLRLPELYLAGDPLDFAAHEWDLDHITGLLADAIRDGRYRARPPTIVRSAKGLGLTRPLAFLTFQDALVYRAIVALADTSLVQSMPPWSRMGRRDERGDDMFSDSGWFRAWLRRQGKLWIISERHEWLVETDIANYFQSLDGRAIVAHVRTDSALDDGLCRLLDHLLRTFSPMVEFRLSPLSGLAQEPSDASRILAHSFLRVLDDAFDREGREDRYSRWMDDIVVGVKCHREAIAVVARVQLALEKVGLYPNRAKTRIYESSDFTTDYMKSVNDYLGEVTDLLNEGVDIDRDKFRRKLCDHLRADGHGRPKAWDRVLRRYYTVSRSLGDTHLLRWWDRHLVSEPTSAAHVFEYLSCFLITPKRVRQLHTVLEQLPRDYQNIRVLAMAFLAQAPNLAHHGLWDDIADFGLEILKDSLACDDDVTASAAIVVIGKFGSSLHMLHLAKLHRSALHNHTRAFHQATILLASIGRISLEDVESISYTPDLDFHLHLRFLRALAAGRDDATGLAYGLLQPVERRQPVRHVIRPRSLWLTPLVRAQDPAKYERVTSQWLRKLQNNRRRLRDRAAERWIEHAKVRPPP